MIPAVLGNYTSEGSFAASWRSSEENQLLIVVLLIVEAIEVALSPILLEERRDSVNFMVLLEDDRIP
jgi:hypothetical protein